jgi:hypothetical protein
VRRGVSAAEMIIAALILGAALVPMYQMFVKGTTTATQSRLAYMALQVAREELEEIRQIPLHQLQGHTWKKVEGKLFRYSENIRGNASNPVLADPKLVYPREYARIWTKLEIRDTNPPDPRMRLAVLDVKWEESGTGSERSREAISHFETIVAAHNVERPL